MKLPEKLLTLRKRSGLFQEALAEQLDVSRQTISRWELGTAQPELGSLLPLCRLLGVPAEVLLDDAQDLPSAPPPIPEAAPRRDRRRVLGWLTLGMGLLGNGVFFLLSRLEKVPFPLISREGGRTWYTWGVQETYSCRWFLYDRHLTACAVLLWLLALAGLLVLLLPPERLRAWWETAAPTEKIANRRRAAEGMPLRRVFRPLYGKIPGQPPCSSTAVRMRGSRVPA